MRQLLRLVCSIAIAVIIAPQLRADELSPFTFEGMEYRLNDYARCAALVGGDMSADTVTIPSEVTCEGMHYTVNSIAYGAFGKPDSEEAASMKAIYLPSSITTVEGGSFINCPELTEFVFPASVTEVGEYVFWYCGKLTKIYSLNPEPPAALGRVSFLTEGVKLYVPAGSLRAYMTADGWMAYQGNVQTFNPATMADVTTDETYPAPFTSGKYDFIATSDTTCRLFALHNGLRREVTVPDSVEGLAVTTFSPFLFDGQERITDITLPKGLTAVSKGCFQACTALTSVTMGDNVTTIDGFAFLGCSALSTVKFSKSLKNIGLYAFYDCRSISEITLPGSLENIETSAFTKCTSLREIVLPDSLLIVDNVAFHYCTNLEKVTFGSSLQMIGSSAFLECTGIKSITARSVIPPACIGSVFPTEVLNNAELTVPETAYYAYKNAPEWRDFLNIEGNVALGIDGIRPDGNLGAAGEVYDLSGRRVKNPVSGFYIVNGRKVFIR